MESFASVTTLPPSETQISIAWEPDERERGPRVRAVDGNDYPSKPSTGNRLIGRLVLAASTPDAFVDTSKGVLFSEPRVGGEVLLRPPGERDVDGANLPKADQRAIAADPGKHPELVALASRYACRRNAGEVGVAQLREEAA